MNDKVTARHLSRKAVLYVRQSTTQQVVQNEQAMNTSPGLRRTPATTSSCAPLTGRETWTPTGAKRLRRR